MERWARAFIVPLAGDPCAFLVALRADGSVRRVYVAPQHRAFGPEQKDRMTSQNKRWFLFVPYDDGTHTFVEWNGVDQRTAERWVGRPFEREDFLDVRSAGGLDAFPETWRVVVS